MRVKHPNLLYEALFPLVIPTLTSFLISITLLPIKHLLNSTQTTHTKAIFLFKSLTQPYSHSLSIKKIVCLMNKTILFSNDLDLNLSSKKK